MPDRLAPALRRNTGRFQQEAFVQRAANALGRDADTIQLLAVSDTDRVYARFTDARARADANAPAGGCFRAVEVRADSLERTARDLRAELPDLRMVVLRAESRWSGGVWSTMYEVLDRMVPLARADGGDLLACAPAGAPGVYCARRDDDDWMEHYDLTVWW